MYEGLVATPLQPAGFDVVPLDPPYSPQRYMAAMDYVESFLDERGIPEGNRGLIVDQISHAWAGPGGVLEYVDRAKTASGTAKGFSAWKDATPMQLAFVERMLRFRGHLIATMRSRVEWVVEKDEKGRQAPRKIGLAPVQREGIEYEFQVMLDLTNEGNFATVSKDRTGQVYGTVFVPSIETGEKIRAFLESGAEVAGVITPSQARTLFAAADRAGVGVAALKDLVSKVAGVEESAKIPASLFSRLLAEIATRTPALPRTGTED